MNVNLDNLADATADALAGPWNFTATIDGMVYPTRAPTLAELAQLETISLRDLHGGKGAALIDSLFSQSPPSVSSWDGDRREKFRHAYLEWLSQKKRLAVAIQAWREVAAAVGARAEAGSANSPSTRA